MDEIALGAIRTRIVNGLESARQNIKKWSDEIADLDIKAAEIQDTLTQMYSEAFVESATATNESTGKLVNPNIDSQKAATNVLLFERRYDAHQFEHREVARDIQKLKNAIICEHERRGDLKAEVELLKLLGSD